MRKLGQLVLQREPAIIRTLFFLAPFVTILFPKMTVTVLIVLSLACIGLDFLRNNDLKPLFRVDRTLMLFGVATLYLFINAAWSLDKSRAFGSALWFMLVVLMTYGSCRALARWPERSLRMAVSAFLVGVSIALAFSLFEVLTGRAGTIALYETFPATQPGSLKGFVIRKGEIIKIAPGELNAIIAVLLLALWPSLLCTMARFSGRIRRICATILFLVGAAAVLFSNHESSKAGILFSVLVFLAAIPWLNVSRKGLAALWCLAFAVAIPLAIAAYNADLHRADWLPFSAKARVVIWAYTAENVPNAPVLGIGGSSTRSIDLVPENRQKRWKKRQKKEGFGWRAGSHAHNVFLQTWYELGAVGVIIFVITGTAVILSLGRLPAFPQRFALAHVAAYLAILAFAWGMWQQWLIALTGLGALYIALGTSYYRAKEQDPGPT